MPWDGAESERGLVVIEKGLLGDGVLIHEINSKRAKERDWGGLATSWQCIMVRPLSRSRYGG